MVEDEPDIRKLVQYNLTQERFSVLEAEDGEQALKLCSAKGQTWSF